VRTTSVPGVSILGAGTLPKNPSQLLGSDRMRTVLDRLRQNYSYVLIDTPAAAGVSDASLLGAMADGILMVVRLGSTPRQFVQQTINVLESLGGNVLGTCLTGAEEPDTTSD
jgi:Mrp family chromosome partitioning ATPase